ncbi:MAG: c-type cytochrome domain-containing protein [Fidelibacterota bacterium]
MLSIILLLFLVGCTELSESITQPVESSLTYLHNIQPLLERSCVRCHGGDTIRGDYDLSTYATAVDSSVNILPGDSTSPLLIQIRNDGSDNMYQFLNNPNDAVLIFNWVVLDSAVLD